MMGAFAPRSRTSVRQQNRGSMRKISQNHLGRRCLSASSLSRLTLPTCQDEKPATSRMIMIPSQSQRDCPTTLHALLHWAVSAGVRDALENRTPAEKEPRKRNTRTSHAASYGCSSATYAESSSVFNASSPRHRSGPHGKMTAGKLGCPLEIDTRGTGSHNGEYAGDSWVLRQ